MASASRRAYLKELFWNQLWQSANFLSKAGFLILLTPLMLWKWGPEGYGLFALASSLLVSMALLDGGVRALTRLRMADADRRGADDEFGSTYKEGLFTFSCVSALAMIGAIFLAATGVLNSLLNLVGGGEWVLALTVVLAGIFMITTFALEPLAAKGKLSALKAANTWGALLGIPCTAIVVALDGSILLTIVVYFTCLLIPNLVLAGHSGIFTLLSRKETFRFNVGTFGRTLCEGGWYYLTTVSLIVKTHGLTFVVSAIAGPAEAGTFYVLLRLTEIVANVGATASETSLAALAAAQHAVERRENFRHSWLYSGVFCLHGALVMAVLGELLLKFWLPEKGFIPLGVGWTMAIFGLAGALSRVVVNAAMGLHIVKTAAQASALESGVALAGAVVGYHLADLPGLFVGGSLGLFFLLPPAWKIAQLCDSTLRELYGVSLAALLPGLAICAAIQVGSTFSPWPLVWFAAVGISGIVALWQLKKIHE